MAEKNRVNHFVAHLNATALLYRESADCHVPVTERATDVLFWPKADMLFELSDVCFWG